MGEERPQAALLELGDQVLEPGELAAVGALEQDAVAAGQAEGAEGLVIELAGRRERQLAARQDGQRDLHPHERDVERADGVRHRLRVRRVVAVHVRRGRDRADPLGHGAATHRHARLQVRGSVVQPRQYVRMQVDHRRGRRLLGMRIRTRGSAWNRRISRGRLSIRRRTPADTGENARGFMDEPAEAALHQSFSDDLAGHVREIMVGAESDAASIRAKADSDTAGTLERARAEAAQVRERAASEAEAAATSRVRRVLEVRRAIADRSEELIGLAGSPAEARSRVGELLDALTDLADRIAREVRPAGDGTLAHLEQELLAAMPPDEKPPPRRRFERRPAPSTNGRGAHDEITRTRLAALRLAVAGATREELEDELAGDLDGESMREVLDDVFGGRSGPAHPETAALASG